jgi:hypothetical protein
MTGSFRNWWNHFLRYFLALILIFQIIPFIFITVWTLLNGGELGLLPPYIFYREFSELVMGYVQFAIFAAMLTLFQFSIRSLIHRRRIPFSEKLSTVIALLRNNFAGRVLLFWVVPISFTFFGTWYLFGVFEDHLEHGIVGCWNHGFPFTYSAGCSTPPTSIPDLTHQKTQDSSINPAYLKNLEFYLTIAVFATAFLNIFALAKNQLVRLFSRYMASTFVFLTIAPPWFRESNDRLLEVGKPWTFLTHYYQRGDGDVYRFFGNALAKDILVCVLAGVVAAVIHLMIRKVRRNIPPPDTGLQ